MWSVMTATVLCSRRTKWISSCRWSRVQIPLTTSRTALSYCNWKVSWSRKGRGEHCACWSFNCSASTSLRVRWPYWDLLLNRCLQSNGSPHWPEVGGYRQVAFPTLRPLQKPQIDAIKPWLCATVCACACVCACLFSGSTQSCQN